MMPAPTLTASSNMLRDWAYQEIIPDVGDWAEYDRQSCADTFFDQLADQMVLSGEVDSYLDVSPTTG